MRRFLLENEEVAKLRERQGLVDLEGFDLRHETSVQGVFGVSWLWAGVQGEGKVVSLVLSACHVQLVVV